MTDIDREALQRCIDLTLAERDIDRVQQVQEMLQERDWEEVATFCAYHRQRLALQLKPWEIPPCRVDDASIKCPRDEHDDAAKLARRLLAAKKSIFEPDPLAALAHSTSKEN